MRFALRSNRFCCWLHLLPRWRWRRRGTR